MSEPEMTASVLGVGLLLVSLSAFAIALTTSRGQLSRNAAFGIRTRATQSSDEAWRRAHEVASPWLTRAWRVGVAGVVLAGLVAVISAAALDSSNVGIVLTIIIVAYVATLVCIAVGGVRANTEAKQVSARG